ncbi:retinol dehydrogenase 8-like [Diadema antillarum]|uniref:retinol dehydrogenase 8-like n=1 Tax=Diadema antillarum TaxID=105358 RepID=UPI003A848D41
MLSSTLGRMAAGKHLPLPLVIFQSSRKLSSSIPRRAEKPQVALVTGCASGIGLATAVLLAKDPQRRFLVYGSTLGPIEKEDALRDAAGPALNDTLFPLQMDVTKDDDVEKAVATVMKEQGRIDILNNNAGIAMRKALETISMEHIKLLFEINFFGTVRLMRAVLPIMKRQQSGRIINQSSRNAIEGAPYMNMYTASKFAVDGISEETAVIGRFFNIWVSVIQAGGVRTSIMDTMVKMGMGGPGSKGVSDHPDVHEIDRRLSTYRDHDLEWSQCPAVSAEEIAEVILRAATDERPHFRYQVSEPVEAIAKRKYRDHTGDEFVQYQVDRLVPFVEGKK